MWEGDTEIKRQGKRLLRGYREIEMVYERGKRCC